MIVSHEHKFIFIKCRKVAGSSMELSLAQCCGEKDIITTDPCKGPVARNYEQPYSLIKQLVGASGPVQIVRSARDWKSRPAFYSHLDAHSARIKLGKKIWNNYYKFCFERNPWDKCVSWYYWFYRKQLKYQRNGPPPPSFREHMLTKRLYIDRNFPVDWRRYSVGDKIIVDFVGNYSQINEDFQKITDDIGIDCKLAHRDKSDFRDQKSHDLSSIYDQDTRQAVGQLFKKEIAHFGFKFPGD